MKELSDLFKLEFGYREDYNEAIHNLNKYSMDEEQLAKLLWEYQQNFLYGKDGLTWEKSISIDKGGMGIEEYRQRAKSIIQNADKWIIKKEKV